MALTDSLVAYWRADEASGDMLDSSGNGRTLTANGSPGSRAGKLGNARDFVPASSQYCSTSDATVLGTISDSAGWTIAGWLYSDTPTATREVCGHFNGASAEGLLVWHYDTFTAARELVVQWWANGSAPVTTWTGVSMTSGAWNFFAIKYDAVADRVYARSNGTTGSGVSCAGKTFTNYAAGFYLGRSRSSGATYWDGGMDDVGVWSRALTGAELDSLYNSGAGLDPTASTGSALPLFAAQLMAMR